MKSKMDPIIAVKNVRESSAWYQRVIGLKSMHGGDRFDILTGSDGQVVLCLHAWGEDGHPTMTDEQIPAGNGLILYLRTENMKAIRERARALNIPVEEETHLNVNSLHHEFALRDPDGYFLIFSEYHDYEG